MTQRELLNTLHKKTRKHLDPHLRDDENVIAVITGGAEQAHAAQPAVNLIRERMQVDRRVSTPTHAPAAGGIADELRKLSELRDQGILSESEFEAAKARTLAGS